MIFHVSAPAEPESGTDAATDGSSSTSSRATSGGLPGDETHQLSLRSVLAHGLATLAASAVALGLLGTVNLVAAAQAQETAQHQAQGSGVPDTSVAVPEPAAEADRTERAQQQASAAAQSDDPGELGKADRAADPTKDDAVRRELDRAMAERQATERGHTLAAENEQAAERSGDAVSDARHNDLVNTDERVQREQARLAEEKRRAEEALRRQREAAAAKRAAEERAAREAAAAAEQAASAPDTSTSGSSSDGSRPSSTGDSGSGQMPPVPSAPQPTSGSGTSPMAAGSYSVGARWGAVGSWSRYHTGQDLPAPVGTPLQAIADGVVIGSNGGGWAGTHVVIRHADGSASLYAHMSGKTVQPGQTVQAGQSIGSVGMTGRTFGPHLHLEHYPDAGTVGDPYSTDDPMRWMMGLGVDL